MEPEPADSRPDDVDSDLDTIAGHLPAGTVTAWRDILPAVPDHAYLAGGTAITVHLQHRISRDLDFFLEKNFDPEALADDLASLGPFAPTRVDDGTLNGVFRDTKVQFLAATTEVHVAPPSSFAGVRVASLIDLLAMKLNTVRDRGQMRDYFDLMVIEQRTPLRVADGLDALVTRYRPRAPQQVIGGVWLALNYFDDVDDDPSLPVAKDQIVAYWQARMRAEAGPTPV